MKTEIMDITPAIASKFLSLNNHNRILTDSRVRQYADSMRDGNWKLNGESIKISIDGRLIDGQHRLKAIIKSGVTIKMLVISGIPFDTFDTIDTGKVRTGGDVLTIAGHKNTKAIAAGINLYLNLLTGNGTATRTDNSNTLAEYEKNKDLYDNLFKKAQPFYKENHRILSTSEFIGYWRFFQEKCSDVMIQSFFDAIENQKGVCGLLYSKLLDNVISTKKKLQRAERRALIIKAFIHHANRVNVKLLRIAIDEPFPNLDSIELEESVGI